MKIENFYAVIFLIIFIAYSFLAFKSPGKFTSPDETANFYFTKQFAKSLAFKVAEPLEKIAPIVAPRSIMVQKDALLPGSFFGMPLLYGAISWFLGKWIILFLTPLFSAIAVFVFYKLINIIFDRRTALISAALMAVHPAFWYYTARGMFHNALFLDLLIVGFYFIAKALIQNSTNYPGLAEAKPRAGKLQTANYFLAGLFIGGAVAVRTSEIIWVGISLSVLIIFLRKKMDWRIGIWIALIGMIISMIPILYQNNKLYGSALTFSYTVGAERAEVAVKAADKASGSASIIAKTFDNISSLIEKAIFPFGIHWDNIFANLWNYGIWLVWPFALLTLFGLITLGKKASVSLLVWLKVFVHRYFTKTKPHNDTSRENHTPQSVYFFLYLFLSIYLILYYGSWKISDNVLGQDAVSLEQSYARYWLPLYVFGLPFAAYFLNIILKIWENKFSTVQHNGLVWLTVFLLFSFSVSSAMAERNAGLAKIRENTVEYKEVADKAKRLIESNAIIVAGKADKVFFPEFKVIASEIDTSKKAKQLKKILQKAPVYIGILDFAGQSEKLNKLKSLGFKIGKEIEVREDIRLYEIIYD